MKLQLYAVEGSSYDGCNGWSSWIMEDSITADKEQAKKYAESKYSTYVRTKVVDYKEIEVDENKITRKYEG